MSEVFADVAVDISISGRSNSFQYAVPEELQETAVPGSIVRVPFGKGGRMVEGCILSLKSRPDIDTERIKPIASVEEGRTTIDSRLIRLALWMHETYGSTLNNALRTVIPVKKKMATRVREEIVLAVPESEAEKLLQQYESKKQTAKARLIHDLLLGNRTDRTDAASRLKVTRPTVDSLIRDGVIKTSPYTAWRGIGEAGEQEELPELSGEQKKVLAGIFREWDEDDRPSLILGVTGSGKTMVYMELIDHVLREGKQVILLIPEISLSWQNIRRFQRRFGNRVSVLNSRMTDGEKSDQFRRIRNGEAEIVVGPRSALFAPFPDLGLIIVDEEQEASYRSEAAPRYDAREAAVKRGELEGAHVVFGSATPSVDSFHRCEEGEYALFRLPHRYGGAAMPAVKAVDMNEELRRGNRSAFSRELREKIRDRLDKKEQVMIFINRRGLSGFVSCMECREVIKCPHCDVPLTLHRNGRLVCHYCGYSQPMPETCPKCGSRHIRGFRAGTEKIENVIAAEFPGARVLRMDADTTSKKGSHGEILERFQKGEADILVGTQMIIKGHDFPRVTLVGVLSADISLFSSDYRAVERTYQLLVQAAGRAGRGSVPGEALIQTYHPEHYGIRAAVAQDYDAFYREEIETRKIMNYPPVWHMLAIHGSGRDEEKLHENMARLHDFLIHHYAKYGRVVGPAPEVIARRQDAWRDVLYFKTQSARWASLIREKIEQLIELNEPVFRNQKFEFDLDA